MSWMSGPMFPPVNGSSSLPLGADDNAEPVDTEQADDEQADEQTDDEPS